MTKMLPEIIEFQSRLIGPLVEDLIAMHKSTAIDLDLWPNAKAMVEAYKPGWRKS